jgi:hypothetical protein
MTRVILLALAMLVVAAPISHAQPKARDDEQRRRELFENDVPTCVRYVRQEVARSEFDAYIEDWVVKHFGTKKDRFIFRKCMSQRGYRSND